MTRAFFLAIVLSPLAGFAADESAVNSTLWAATAVEHDAVTRQTYHHARMMLDRALRDRKWTAAIEQANSGYRRKPPAIIMDIDETIVDNTPFQARLFAKGTRDMSLWPIWTAEARAKALPGAVEFTRYAQSRGVTIFYVTNRDAAEKAATKANLEKAGFPFSTREDTLYCRGEKPEWVSDKSSRRTLIASHYRILLLIGDDLNDFMSGGIATLADRRKLVEPYQDYWGVKWIMLPNAMYGSWETAICCVPPTKDEEEQRRRKTEALMKLLE